jgi:hypothetical protein
MGHPKIALENKKGGLSAVLISTLHIYYLKLEGVNVTSFPEIYLERSQSFTKI